VKLSAPERLTDAPDGDGVAALARELLDSAPERMLWAGDWPHTGRPARRRRSATRRPSSRCATSTTPVPSARFRAWTRDEAEALRVLVENPAGLYGF
jgi:predicted TIM-barrel fold metal-dependent hydrolase